MPPEEKKQLMEFLADKYETFSLEGEREETDIMEMVIDTEAGTSQDAVLSMPGSSSATQGNAAWRGDRTIKVSMGKPCCSRPET